MSNAPPASVPAPTGISAAPYKVQQKFQNAFQKSLQLARLAASAMLAVPVEPSRHCLPLIAWPKSSRK
jgi:hypothetical protein